MAKTKLPFIQQFFIIFNEGSNLLYTAIGCIFLYFIVPVSFSDIDYEELIYLNFNTAIGKGKIVNIYETGVYRNDEPVLGYEYIFYSSIGNFTWTSYGKKNNYKVGNFVPIKYHISKPHINRIEFLSVTPLGWFQYYLYLIPFLVFLLFIVRGYRKYLIIKNGIVTDGLLIRRIKTNSESDDETVYKYFYKYSVKGVNYETYYKSTKSRGERSTPIVYHRKNPQKVVILCSLNIPVEEEIATFLSNRQKYQKAA